MTRRTAVSAVVFAALFGVLDVFLKYIALTRLSSDGRVSFPIDFILHKNEGIAFNIPLPLPIIIAFSVLVLVTVPPFVAKHWSDRKEQALGALVLLIGALGNLIDRIIHGFTTDYILLFGRSVINLSDILIITGVVMLLWYNEKRSEGQHVRQSN